MTAEVAILNRQAVALAADSAVTISGPNGQKIYNTVNKLFSLSKHFPVGIMAYSSADVMGVPVETLVKVYRRNLGEKSFSTLNEYAKDFIKFLTDDPFFSEEARLEHCRNVVDSMISRVYRSIQRDLVRLYPGWKQPTEDEAKDTAIAKLNYERDYFQKTPNLPGVTARIRQRLKQDVSSEVNFWRDTFEKEFGLARTDSEAVEGIALGAILKEARNNKETGFVIAGFGESEIFPHLYNFELEASIYGVHKVFEEQVVDATRHAHIVPFAQTEMVDTFVFGRALSLDTYLERFICDFFDKQKSEQIEYGVRNNQDMSAVCQVFDELKNDLVKQFNDQLKEFTLSKHTYPLMETVTVMPKEELAAMAEALVNLTANKRRLSSDMETVGGPTDVAVISKGDGFIWIKRKHYFDSALNQQFGYNYNRRDMKSED